ncbi:PIG-L deacetylase family protein [Deinococcus malanensis]|uniref:PIG-L deacetylase family protein n=1 Tax=Deinococcus malanensis TaxID=1706855 RepID=UPI00363287C3
MRIMAVFAHPDDEIGCIGTLAKHAARGDEVMLVWTTLGELASQFGDQTHEEVTRVRREHGAWVAGKIGALHHFFDMGDSRMTGSRTEALQLARLYAQFRPNAVITWSDDHPHPDHRMTAKIAFDAITLARIPKIINEEGAACPWRPPRTSAEAIRWTVARTCAGWKPGGSPCASTSTTHRPAPTRKSLRTSRTR